LENIRFFAFFFGKKNGFQKSNGKFYVLAALSYGFLLRRFGNPLRKFFCGFGFVEFLCGQPLCQKGFGVGRWLLSLVLCVLRVRLLLSFLYHTSKKKFRMVNSARSASILNCC
jgi:hypothetical protein